MTSSCRWGMIQIPCNYNSHSEHPFSLMGHIIINIPSTVCALPAGRACKSSGSVSRRGLWWARTVDILQAPRRLQALPTVSSSILEPSLLCTSRLPLLKQIYVGHPSNYRNSLWIGCLRVYSAGDFGGQDPGKKILGLYLWAYKL